MNAGRAYSRALAVTAMLFVTLGAQTATAQETSKQLWGDYNPSWAVSDRVDVFGDVGLRSEIENDGWWRLVVRPGAGVPVGHFRITAGIGNFVTFNDVIDNRWEIRPFQGVSVVWPNRRLAFDHYLRLEERFDFNTETWNSLNSLRIRYRLRATYRWAAHVEERYWTVTSSGEGFYTITGNEGQQREQFRVTAGIERNFSHQRRIRFEISWQQESLFFNPDETVNDIYVRFRIYRRW